MPVVEVSKARRKYLKITTSTNASLKTLMIKHSVFQAVHTNNILVGISSKSTPKVGKQIALNRAYVLPLALFVK